MRIRVRQLLGVALVAGAAVASDTATASALDGAHRVVTPPYITCPAPPTVPPGAPGTSARSGANTATDVLEAAVPRLTLIHVVDGRLVVTTNTQAPPDPTDQFYVATGKRARVATPVVRDRVMRACR